MEGIDSTPTILVSNESLGQAHLKNAMAPLNFDRGEPPEAGEGQQRPNFFFGLNGTL